MTYLAEYAATGRSSCHGLECTEKGIAEGQLRIGIGNSQTVWYHVDCFFKHLIDLGPQNLKLRSSNGFLLKRGDLTEEDRRQLDQKIDQCHKDKENKKRKAEEDINDRYSKIAKLDLPPLFTDNLMEILCRFDTHQLLIASRVNKQFCAVSRKIIFTRKICVPNTSLYKMKPNILNFAQKIQKLKIKEKLIPDKQNYVAYSAVILQLTNLQSLTFNMDLKYIRSSLETLTQLQSMEFSVNDHTHYQRPLAPAQLPNMDNFKELKNLSLKANALKVLTDELSPVMTQLTYLRLTQVDVKSLRNFTNLERLELNYTGNLASVALTNALELPRLTSLLTLDSTSDFTKFTQLKRLLLPRGRIEGEPLILPLNLEQLSTHSMPLPDIFPTTLKTVRVFNPRKALFTSLTKLSDQCALELYFNGFCDVPAELLARKNLTVVICTRSYGNTGWESAYRYLNGPLPDRLHIQFYQWKNCRFKPKLLELIKKVETKIRLLVDFSDSSSFPDFSF